MTKQQLAQKRNWFKYCIAGSYRAFDLKVLTAYERRQLIVIRNARANILANFDKNSKAKGLKVNDNKCVLCSNKKFRREKTLNIILCKKHYLSGIPVNFTGFISDVRPELLPFVKAMKIAINPLDGSKFKMVGDFYSFRIITLIGISAQFYDKDLHFKNGKLISIDTVGHPNINIEYEQDILLANDYLKRHIHEIYKREKS